MIVEYVEIALEWCEDGSFRCAYRFTEAGRWTGFVVEASPRQPARSAIEVALAVIQSEAAQRAA